MKRLSNTELLSITGGAWYSAAFFNAISRAATTLMDIGKSLGTSIRRLIDGSICPL